MRQNTRRFFHVFIITSICCMALSGCGYKTAPVYVADDNNVSEQNTLVDQNTTETMKK